MLNKRTHILFDTLLWNRLSKLAKSEDTSIGQIVREAVEKRLQENQILLQRKKAIDEIKRIRPHLKGRVDYKALINYGRKYQ